MRRIGPKIKKDAVLSPKRRVFNASLAGVIWLVAYFYGKYSFLTYATPVQMGEWDIAHAIHFFATLVVIINSFLTDNLVPAVNWSAYGVIFFLSIPNYFMTVTGNQIYSYVNIFGVLSTFVIIGFFVIRWMRGDWG
ncbi:MAG: hypothetical protein HRU80_14205 [Ignavibacteriales bacterium]|nr:MAG: hypothetical protein HRU80_14205 [Ignavibacteriales bacterium]